jgi:hypothetical protein
MANIEAVTTSAVDDAWHFPPLFFALLLLPVELENIDVREISNHCRELSGV